MSKFKDLSNQRFGKLVALKPHGRSKNDTLWLCCCDCGNEKVVSRGALTAKNGTRSCGCLAVHENLCGQRFNSLVVKEKIGYTSDGKILWLCECDCGKTSIVRGNFLKCGHTKTCGHCWENEYEFDYTSGVVFSHSQSGISFCFDIEDFDKVNQYRWYSNPPQNYIYTIIARRKVPLHTFLLNSNSDSPIDHINRLKTDNRKSNLRYANKQGNSANMGLSRRNKTGAKGVDLLPGGKFKARIGFNNRKVELGTFNTFAEAATAYDNAAQLYFGDFACTNAMLEKEAKRLEAVASE